MKTGMLAAAAAVILLAACVPQRKNVQVSVPPATSVQQPAQQQAAAKPATPRQWSRDTASVMRPITGEEQPLWMSRRAAVRSTETVPTQTAIATPAAPPRPASAPTSTTSPAGGQQVATTQPHRAPRAWRTNKNAYLAYGPRSTNELIMRQPRRASTAVRWQSPRHQAAPAPTPSVAAADTSATRVEQAAEEPAAVTQTAALAEEPEQTPIPPDWRQHFSSIPNGAILIGIDDRRVRYWGPEGAEFKEFPVAVARSPELTKMGKTHVARKKVGPDWRPTPSMLKRDPKLPKYVPPGPENPLGEYALYLDWRYYAIHGTNNPNSIGTRATSGCFRLYPDDIEYLFSKVGTGTPVMVVPKL